MHAKMMRCSDSRHERIRSTSRGAKHSRQFLQKKGVKKEEGGKDKNCQYVFLFFLFSSFFFFFLFCFVLGGWVLDAELDGKVDDGEVAVRRGAHADGAAANVKLDADGAGRRQRHRAQLFDAVAQECAQGRRIHRPHLRQHRHQALLHHRHVPCANEKKTLVSFFYLKKGRRRRGRLTARATGGRRKTA